MVHIQTNSIQYPKGSAASVTSKAGKSRSRLGRQRGAQGHLLALRAICWPKARPPHTLLSWISALPGFLGSDCFQRCASQLCWLIHEDIDPAFKKKIKCSHRAAGDHRTVQMSPFRLTATFLGVEAFTAAESLMGRYTSPN